MDFTCYLCSFQEIVPLNAGNILGAEDNRPVPKWEHIIRETLNKIQPVKTMFKCHSGPPSPSKFKPPDDVPIMEDEILSETDSESDVEIHPLDEGSLTSNLERDGYTASIKDSRFYEEARRDGNIDLGFTDFKQQSSLRRLDRLNCLNLTDYSTISETPVVQPKVKLTRMLSGSERVGLSWPERPLDLVPQLVLDGPDSFKSVKSFRSSKSFKLSMRASNNRLSETIVVPDLDLESLINRKKRSDYVRIISKQMVGIFFSIWVRRNLRKHVQNLKVSTVGVGVMGYIGNKVSCFSLDVWTFELSLFSNVCLHVCNSMINFKIYLICSMQYQCILFSLHYHHRRPPHLHFGMTWYLVLYTNWTSVWCGHKEAHNVLFIYLFITRNLLL